MTVRPCWTVDDSQWPVVIHSVEGTLSDADLDAYIAQATRVLSRGGPQATVLDASRIGKVSAYVRSRSVEWQREHAALLKANCVATAYVLTSPVLRFVAMTVFVVTRLPTPLRVFATRDDAIRWCEERLAAQPPPSA
jgi:hypothetical protein